MSPGLPQVMILAAGRSTRLGDLGAVLPKPLLPICGYPAIDFGLALCRQAGFDDAVINVHHHAGLLQRSLGAARLGVNIRYSVERDLLGTGGGIAAARSLFRTSEVLVMNGKVVADVDFAGVVAAFRASPAGTVATMVVREDPDPAQWAPVTIDTAGRVVGIRDAVAPGRASGAVVRRMFTGIHMLSSRLLDHLPPGVSDVIGDAYIPALLAGETIIAVTVRGYFAEHSTPERYLEGNRALLQQPGLVPHPPGPLVGVDAGALVDPTARIIMPSRVAAGAIIEGGAVAGPGAVVCTGARVAAGVHVEDAVIWPGATATADVRNAAVFR